MEYLTRTQLIDELKALRQKVKKGAKRKEVIDTLDSLITQSTVEYKMSVSSGIKQEILEEVTKHPGIKYQALADELGRSVNYLKRVVETMEEVEVRVLAKEKGMFGNKPYGLFPNDP